MQQLLARFPAAVPALLPEQLAQQQPGLTAAAAGGDSGEDAPTGAAGSGGGEGAPTAAPGSTVALVFGREESGLLENELLLCSHACAIPTGKHLAAAATAAAAAAAAAADCGACRLSLQLGACWQASWQLCRVSHTRPTAHCRPAGRSQPSLNLSHATAVVLSQLFDLKQQSLMLARQRRQRQQQQDGQQQGQQQDQDEDQEQQPGQQRQQQQEQGMSGSLFESGELASMA